MSEISKWLADTRQIDYILNLKTALEKKNMTNQQFAKICGCRTSTINKILSKNHFVPIPKYVWEKARIELNI